MSNAIYRFEHAKSRMAGCTGTLCAKDKVKIAKGELRFGNLVTIQEHTSWKWKHWSCVTPYQLGNLVEQMGGRDQIDWDDEDFFNVLDGFDEVDDESRVKILRALKQGHVDDDDWIGDIECNRPGKKGYTVKTPKKKQEVKDEAGETAANGEETPVKPKAKKGRGKAVKKEESDDDDNASPPQKKGKGKRKAPKADDEEDEVKEKPQRKSRAKKVKQEENSDVELDAAVAEEEKPKTKPRGRKVKKEEQDEETQEEAATVKAESSTANPRNKKVKAESGANTDNAASVSQPKSRNSRAKKIKKAESDGEEQTEPAVKSEGEDEEVAVPVKNEKPTKANKKTATKSKPKALETEDGETDNLDANADPAVVTPEPVQFSSANGGIDYSDMPHHIKNKVKFDVDEPVDLDLSDIPAANAKDETTEEQAKPKAKRGRKPAASAPTTTASSSTKKADVQTALKATKVTKTSQTSTAVGTRRSARNAK